MYIREKYKIDSNLYTVISINYFVGCLYLEHRLTRQYLKNFRGFIYLGNKLPYIFLHLTNLLIISSFRYAAVKHQK